MKRLKIIAMLFALGLLWHPNAFGQVENRTTVTGNGGGGGQTTGTTGNQSGQTLEHFGVAGEGVVASPVNGLNGSTITHIGFIYTADDGFGEDACLVPDGLQVTALTDNSATITWNFIEASYNYQYRIVGTETWTPGIEGSGSVSLTSLEAGTAYEFQLQADCGNDGSSEFTESLEFTTFGPPACEEPLTVSLANITTTGATVSWASPTNEPSTYIVEYRSSSETDWTSETAISGNQFVLTSLLSGTIYQVRVGSECPNGNIFANALIFETTGEPDCSIPILIEPSDENVTTESITISWLGDADTYDVQIRSLGSTNWNLITSVTGNNYTFENLESGTPYEIQARATCTGTPDITTDFSTTVIVETDGAAVCVAPSTPFVTNISETGASINWGATDGSLLYNVQYRAFGAANWITTQSIQNSNNLTGLIPNTVYVVRVNSVCEFGTEGTAFSPALQFTTLQSATPCNVPTNTSSSVDQNNIGETTISWDDMSSTAYEVRFKQKNNLIWNSRVVQSTSTLIDGLTAGQTYDYQVRSYCGPTGAIRSAFSTTKSFTIPLAFVCDIPASVVATPGTELLSLSWTTNPNAFGYYVRFRVKGAPFWTQRVLGSPGDLTGLIAGTEYEFGVSTICSANGNVTSAFSATQSATVLGAPTCTVPVVSSVTPGIGSVTIDWNDASADNNYILRYRLKGTPNWTFIDGLSVSEFASGATLQEGMIYQYQVQSVCSGVSSAYTSLAEFTTLGAPTCEVPILSTNATPDVTSIMVSWGAAAGAERYQLQFRVSGSAFWNTIDGLTGTNFTATGLQAGTSYQFRVRTVCNTDATLTSAYSAIREFSTLGEPFCDTPINVTASVTGQSVLFAWTASTEAEYYHVRFRLKNTTAWTNSNAVGNQLNVGGLAAGAQYEYQIRSVCDQDPFFASPFTSIATLTTDGLPCVAPSASVSNVSNTTADVSWAGVGTATSYEYRYRPSGASAWTIETTENLSIQLSDLFAGTDYQFRIKSICSAGVTSDLSGLITFTTTGASSCDEPVDLTVDNTTQSAASLSWVGDELSYDVQYRSFGSPEWITVTGFNSATATLTNLTASEEYEWRVRSICSVDRSLKSGYSVISTFTTTTAASVDITTSKKKGNGSSVDGSNTEEISAPESVSDIITAGNGEDGSDLKDQLAVPFYELTLYPNPFSERINIALRADTDANVTIEVFDIAGDRVSEVFAGLVMANQISEYEFVGMQLPDGVYLISIQGLSDLPIHRRIILRR
ncbi:MAG: fibronectin type III domain-containing protein [Cyclobacteriaceae bacterium]